MSPMFLNPVQAPWAMKEVGACWCLKTRKLHICCRSDSDDEQALYNFWHSVLCFGEMWIFEKVRYTYFSAVPPWPVLFSNTSYRLHANSTLQMVEQISFEIKSDMLPRDSVLVPFCRAAPNWFFCDSTKRTSKGDSKRGSMRHAICNPFFCTRSILIESYQHRWWQAPKTLYLALMFRIYHSTIAYFCLRLSLYILEAVQLWEIHHIFTNTS